MSPAGEEMGPQPGWRAARWLLPLLLLAQLGLLERVAASTGPTWDERLYVFYGSNQVRKGEMCVNPVPAWGFGLAQVIARTANVDPDFVVRDPAQAAAAWWRLFACRQATVGVSLLTTLVLWLTARRWGESAGLAAATLWALSPSTLAHGSLATLDVWAAAAAAAALWAGVRWVEEPTPRRAALVGLFAALGVGAKVTVGGVMIVALAGAAWWRRDLVVRHGIAACAAFAAGVWASHGFDVGPLVGDGGRVIARGLPAPKFVEAMAEQFLHGFVKGHSNVVLGQQVEHGVWWYWPVCVALKVTGGSSLLGAVALALAWGEPGRRRVDAALLSFPLLLLGVLSVGGVQLGIRYLLPAFPGAAIWAARVPPRVAWALILVGTSQSLMQGETPLTFASWWAGSAEAGVRMLPVGSDWCQARPELLTWLREHKVGRVYYVPCGPYRLDWAWEMPPCKPTRGVYALHASELLRARKTEAACLDWLRELEPDAVLGHTIYLFDERETAR